MISSKIKLICRARQQNVRHGLIISNKSLAGKCSTFSICIINKSLVGFF